MQARPTRTSLRNQGAKRPDKAIYVPRAARERLPLSPSPLTTIDVGLPNLGPSGSTQSVTSASSLCSSSSYETTEGTLSCAPNQNNATDSLAESTAYNSHQLLGEQKDMFVQLNGANSSPWPPALDHVVSYFMAVTLEDSEEEMHGQENLIDGKQELNISEIPAKTTEDASSFSEEIMVHLKDASVSIEHAHNDYSCYEALWINQEEFSHVIEIYDFPHMFKTEDLQDAFTEYSTGGMKIKWVDDTHALGVFSSQSAASHALSLRHPLLKTRTLSEGSRKSKCKAVRRAEFIQPVKERPRTDSAVARRMVTRALGLQKAKARVQRY